MTIYKPIKIEAETAAEVAVAIANGDDVGETTDYQGGASTARLRSTPASRRSRSSSSHVVRLQGRST